MRLEKDHLRSRVEKSYNVVGPYSTRADASNTLIPQVTCRRDL